MITNILLEELRKFNTGDTKDNQQTQFWASSIFYGFQVAFLQEASHNVLCP